MKQPVVYVEDTTVEDKLVGIIFCLFIMFTMLIFFSRYLIQEETAPINITDAQFDLLANKSKLPEGFDNQIIATTGDDYLNTANLSLETLSDLTGLQECPEGECAIDLKTGIKRCPQNANSRIVYNRAFEGCTAKFFCTEDSLPYAIRSSGETDTFGVCDQGVECRCSAQVVCPKFVVSSFNLYNGSSFTGLRKDLNYYFDQTTLDDDKIVGYDSIVIPQERTNVQFCNINPSYLDRLSGGCNFTNGDNDILGCNDSHDFFSISGASFNEIGSDLPIGFQNNPNSDFKTLGYQNTLNVGQNDQSEARKPSKGYAQYLDDTTLRFVSYQQNNKNSDTINQTNLSSLSGVFSWGFDTAADGGNISSNVGIPESLGGVNPSTGNNDALSFMKVIYTGCTDSSGIDISNKNMLLCLQNDTQPCKEGVFSYQVDTKPASQFCQYNPSLTNYIKNDGDFDKSVVNSSPPLDDPQFFTLSCVTGPGCNGGYSQSFCKNGDCTTAIDTYKSIFQDYDDSALNGVWELRQISATDPPQAGVISFSYDSSKGIVLRNNGLFTIDPGDYFSTVRSKFQKLLIKEVIIPSPPTTIEFSLGSVDGLEAGYSVYASGFRGTIASGGVDTTNNKITIDSDFFASVTSIPAYALIDGYKPVEVGGDGNDFGIFIVGGGRILPGKLDGTISTFSNGVPDTIFLYKQFGFNGLNYNSDISFSYQIPAKGDGYFTAERKYNSLSQWSYWLSQYQSNIDDLLVTPLSSAVVPIVIQTEAQVDADPSSKRINRQSINSVVFSDPNADFKQDLSFYYPVWSRDKNSQVCIKCKPALYTYVKINQDSQMNSAVIQFSGKDFGQYMYYPQFALDSSNKFVTNYDKSPFVFNVFSTLSQDSGVVSTTKRIVLQNPNPNLPYSSEVDSDYYTTNPYYILDGNNNINRNFFPVQEGSVFPLNGRPSPITLDTIPLQDGGDQKILLDDCYIPFVFNGRVLEPNTTQQISLDSTGQRYANFNPFLDSNWFAGKKYFAGQNMILVKSQVRVISVELIAGRQVIFTDSTTNVPIQTTANSDQDPTVIQIYSENDTLDLGFDQDVTDQTTQRVVPNSITGQRITSLVFPTNANIVKSIAALPSIVFTKYRNLQ